MKRIRYKQLASTNSHIKEMLQSDSMLPHFTVISTDYQTSGRGQRENRWESCEGQNLLFSILLCPEEFKASEAFAISRIVSVAIAKWLATYIDNVSIKWPNDIYCGDKKICGILIENSMMGLNISTSIVGVGININQTVFSSFIPNPTSLSLITGKNYVIEDMLNGVLIEIEKQYNSYFSGISDEINALYHNMLYRLNIPSKYNIVNSFASTKRAEVATIVGVEPNGCLMLKHSDETVCSYAFKEVEFIL